MQFCIPFATSFPIQFKFMNGSRTQKDILNSHNCASQASKRSQLLSLPSCFEKYHIALHALFLTVHFDVRRLAKLLFSPISSLSPARPRRVCVVVSTRVYVRSWWLPSHGVPHTQKGSCHSLRVAICVPAWAQCQRQRLPPEDIRGAVGCHYPGTMID